MFYTVAVSTEHITLVDLMNELFNAACMRGIISNIPFLLCSIPVVKLQTSRVVFAASNTSDGCLILSEPRGGFFLSTVHFSQKFLSISLIPRVVTLPLMYLILFAFIPFLGQLILVATRCPMLPMLFPVVCFPIRWLHMFLVCI